jgi:hypothetical protein
MTDSALDTKVDISTINAKVVASQSAFDSL